MTIFKDGGFYFWSDHDDCTKVTKFNILKFLDDGNGLMDYYPARNDDKSWKRRYKKRPPAAGKKKGFHFFIGSILRRDENFVLVERLS